ncbi:hypothetical protein [Tropicimonas sp. S265A]|uniref:hypothetical protein n=1 Tax=Tropicimonas sp. S265A TaxID=3415134 RepID=UPI003C7BEB21
MTNAPTLDAAAAVAEPALIGCDLSFDELCAHYTTMRQAMTRMSLLNLQLRQNNGDAQADELLNQFDRACDDFLASNAPLEIAGLWRMKDEAYLRTDQAVT